MARKRAGVVQLRRETREHVALYLKAFNGMGRPRDDHQLRFTAREPVPAIAKLA